MHARLRKLIEDRHETAVGLLRDLVLESSFTDDRSGCNAVGARLCEELAAIAGISTRTVGGTRYGDVLIASTARAAASAEGAVLLVGHLDTVFPKGSFEGFRVDGAIARGPGVLDMKGGLVVMLEALRALSALGALDDLAVRMIVVADEEVGSPESFATIQEASRGAAAALVFESGRAADRVITARKGTGSVTAVARGKAAHAGNAHEHGANAIWALARFVDRAQQLTDYTRGLTVNVGMIRGGESKNTVPDRAEAKLDLRFVHAADRDGLVERLRAAAAESAASVSGTNITFERVLSRPALERSDENLELYREYAACAAAEGLGSDEAPLVGGGSDASTTASVGVPSIDGLGPRGSGFHTHEELVELATLSPKAAAVARLLLGRRPRGR